ncbi:MAG: SMP-30/gluconolactonase/LRE family protein [Planctomycetota bacterium]
MMRLAFVALFCLPLVVHADVPTPKVVATGPMTRVATGFAFTEGPAASDAGDLYFTDIPNTTIHRLAADGTLSVFKKQSNHANGLWYLGNDRLLACEMDGAIVRYDLTDRQRTIVVDQYEGKRFNACNDCVVDRDGGIYFTDPQYRAPTPLPQEVRAVYYLSPDGITKRLTGDLAAPNGIGLSPDETTLYIIPSMQAEMLAFDVIAPGDIDRQRTFCVLKQPADKSDSGGDGMSMDEQGNLYITTDLGIQIFSPVGEPLGIVPVPERPANVTFGGPDFKTMYITARTSLYQVPMPIAGLRRTANE